MSSGLSPDREELVRQLREYASRWPDEAAAVARFAAYIAATPRCFERGLAAGHVTGSAWLVNRAGTHVLLTHHRKLGMWVQLGGHADGDGDLLRVARREAEEESGLAGIVPLGPGIFDIDVHRIPARGAEAEHLHWDVRHAFRAAGSEAYRVSEESHDLAWVEIRSLSALTAEESMLRMARKWLAGGIVPDPQRP